MKRAKVVVIYKSGDKNNFSNYRPISILPIFSKALEKIISVRINSFCDKHSILSTQQFGFRKGRSTELALLAQKEIILQSFEDNKLTMGIFIDFSKAFDSLNHRSLLLKLEYYGFRGVVLELFRSYLENREQCVLINEYMSKFMTLTAGVPQGSTLGPLLFNLYVNDIVNITTQATFIIYADDTSIFVQSNSPDELCQMANATLHKINLWSTANSLKINSTKTKAVVFTPFQKRLNYQFCVRIGSNNIEVVSEVKTLGVIFNQHLSWNSHVRRVLGSLAKITGALYRVRHVIPEKFKLLVFQALFSAQVNYCILVWGTTSMENINRIYSAQRKSLRHIANVSYDSPVDHLYRSYNVLPFPLLYKFNLLLRYRNSLKFNNKTFLSLSNLQSAPDTGYSFRNRDDWLIPFCRTNHGLDMVKNRVPRILNKLASEGIYLNSTTPTQLKLYFLSCLV